MLRWFLTGDHTYNCLCHVSATTTNDGATLTSRATVAATVAATTWHCGYSSSNVRDII